MLPNWLVFIISLLYLGILFAIAYYADWRADNDKSIINNPYIYALSLAVYCTAWTFYGSVGRAASTGWGFLPVYIGPTIIAPLWLLVIRKIIRISKQQHITSIADFISSRYGKSTFLGGLVAIIAVVGIIPYISLQLKAISSSYSILTTFMNNSVATANSSNSFFEDTAFYISILLATFAILFGTRHLDASERHEGLVAAIAFESIIKLVAFLFVGLFVTYFLYGGLGDIFSQARRLPDFERFFTINQASGVNWDEWVWITLLSLLAVMFLPRQFHMAVVENTNEKHIEKAIWLFPLYLFLINLFVLPIAVAGLLHFPGNTVDADTFVLALPLTEGHRWIALFVFIGGLSAATSMVIVATISLSIMVSNNIVMPILLRVKSMHISRINDLTWILLMIRRGSIIVLVLWAYFYFRVIAEYYTLVSIGLISFTAAAQFAPAIIGGIFWRGGTRNGALAGLIAGSLVWAFTLPTPFAAEAGLLPDSILTEGLFGISLLRPYQFLGLEGMDPISSSLFWSLLFNIGLYVIVSFSSRASVLEHSQAAMFVKAPWHSANDGRYQLWRGTSSIEVLESLLTRFIGEQSTKKAFFQYAQDHKTDWEKHNEVDQDFISYTEQLLTGAIGAASARVVIASVVKEEPFSVEEMMNILNETQQAISQKKVLEKKSQELEKATADLMKANTRLRELDRLKDDFVATVTHELRTPLTSVRAFAEILHDNPDLRSDQKHNFLNIIIKESERLTRLINQVLDLQKVESKTMELELTDVQMDKVVTEAFEACSQLAEERKVICKTDLPLHVPRVPADRDRLMQVMLNLISNGIKFSKVGAGKVVVKIKVKKEHLQIDVTDNGIGINKKDQQVIFEKFRQINDPDLGKPAGSGLGLTITQKIIEFHQGTLWVKSAPEKGSTFSFTLPINRQEDKTVASN
ncbi:MAG: histidine kinase [Calditrichaeota bacterium]|nr:MAG: histidine kinase [Calditrichota bacterium]